jgi:hypothetical protein
VARLTEKTTAPDVSPRGLAPPEQQEAPAALTNKATGAAEHLSDRCTTMTNVSPIPAQPLTDRIKLLNMEARIDWWVAAARDAVVSEDARRLAA